MIKKVLIGMIIMCVASLAACGGGSSSTASSAATGTVSLTGTVAAPSVASSNIAVGKGIAKAGTLSDSASQCESIEVYQMTTGTEVASGECNADGTFTLTCDQDEMKGEASDETGDDFTFRGVFHAVVDDKDLYGYVESSVGSSVSSIAIEQIDADVSIAVLDMLSKLGISDFDDLPNSLAALAATAYSSFDPHCFFKLQKEIMESADATDEASLNDEAAKARDACKVTMASGSLPGGYTNWGQFMKDCVHGDLSADAQTEVGGYVDNAGLSYMDGATYTANYASYTGVMDKFYSAGEVFAGSAGMTALSVAAPLAKAEEASAEAPCDSVKTDSDYLDNFAAVFLDSTDTDEFDKNFGFGEGMDSSEAFGVWFGTFNEFKKAGDWLKFDSDAMNSTFAAFDGNFESFYEGEVLSGTAISTVHGFMDNTDFDSFGDDEGAMKDYFAQMGSTFETQDWSDLYGNEEVYAANWQGQYETASDAGGSGAITFTAIDDDTATGATSCLDECKAAGGTNETCFDDCFGGAGGGEGSLTSLSGNYSGTRSGCPDVMGASVAISDTTPYFVGPVSITWTSGEASCVASGCSICTVSGTGAAGTILHGVCSIGGGMFPNCDFTYTKQ